MASLQTLRNKGGVIVAVIIGIALLAFILGDMLTSGSVLFGNSANNVGKIGGQGISAVEYGNQINYLTEIQKISS
ncbi:MAG: SurA N-terminal domain-containing protein, partial [Mucinivorans sp.]